MMYLDYYYKKDENNVIRTVFENQLQLNGEDSLVVVEGGFNHELFNNMLSFFNKLMLPVFVIPHCTDEEYMKLRKQYPFLVMGTNIPVEGTPEEKGLSTMAVMEQLARTLEERKRKREMKEVS